MCPLKLKADQWLRSCKSMYWIVDGSMNARRNKWKTLDGSSGFICDEL